MDEHTTDASKKNVTLQIPVTPGTQYAIAVNAATHGVTRQEYIRQAIAFAMASTKFTKHMGKVYSDGT